MSHGNVGGPRGDNGVVGRGRPDPTKKAPSSARRRPASPTDPRRSGCRSEGHQPSALLTRCTEETKPWQSIRQVGKERKTRKQRKNSIPLPHNPGYPALISRTRCRSTQKCTEPVAPSSGYPTDRRRSDRLLGSHRPQVLRTRCIGDARDSGRPRQAAREPLGHENMVFAKISLLAESDCGLSGLL